jgi:hypothetical protein
MDTLQHVSEIPNAPPTKPNQRPLEDGPPALCVELLYEDAQTGLRARHALDGLADALKLEADFHVDLLRLDLLRDPALREAAKEQAACADILLLSAHGWEGLPTFVSGWLTQWMEHDAGRPRALVLSLDAGAGASIAASRLLTSLKAAAGTGGVDVFSHFSDALGSDWTMTMENLQHRAEARSSVMDETLRRVEPYSHWGINE